MGQIKMVRVYEFDPGMKGKRMLVDRLWPRGIKKETIEPFLWEKEITPTSDLRKWFNHDPERFEAFKEDYVKELEENPEADDFLKKVSDILKEEDLILLYAAKDKTYNHVVILKDWIEEKLDA
ncbi:MAG: DUF488 family protein [Peptoniphilus sp.]|nr:DUF488 family protein [Peptoniphilus sp.]MDD7362851.1 DUF488 family protein [Bacillota bacterium]MDY6043957.1 DUF488 family protein [Peptoniphilus sp.]